MSPNRPIPKGQHQMPRFYLERFAGREPEGQVWSYDMDTGKVWSATPENTAKETHLYSVTLEDGQRITDLEDFIAGVEGKAACVYDKLLAGEKIEGQERADLASFFAMTFVRTSAFRRIYAEIMVGFQVLKMYVTAEHEGAFRSAMEKYEADRGPLSDEERAALREGMLHPEKFKVSVNREWTLRALMTHDRVAPVLFGMHWSVTAPPEGRYFITSDNPFVRMVPDRYYRPMMGEGFLNKHIEVSFPLSPKRCLLAHWRNDYPNLVTLPPEGVKLANRARAVYAERFLYGPRQDAGIAALARKYKETKPGMQLSGLGPEKYPPVKLRRR